VSAARSVQQRSACERAETPLLAAIWPTLDALTSSENSRESEKNERACCGSKGSAPCVESTERCEPDHAEQGLSPGIPTPHNTAGGFLKSLLDVAGPASTSSSSQEPSLLLVDASLYTRLHPRPCLGRTLRHLTQHPAAATPGLGSRSERSRSTVQDAPYFTP
jgi:hypothetical protein